MTICQESMLLRKPNNSEFFEVLSDYQAPTPQDFPNTSKFDMKNNDTKCILRNGMNGL